ncbi:zinc-dependent metalloprotease, partial [Kitasatospora sp. NPDC001574]
LRDAARLWALLADARGVEGRDDLWQHPDMLPTAADLDDPDAFVHRDTAGSLEGGLDFDAIDKLLGEAAAGGGTGTSGPAAEPGSGPKPDLTKNDDEDGKGEPGV